MAKDDPRDRIRREQREIGSPEGLFEDDTQGSPQPVPNSAPEPGFGSGEVFALADGPSSVELAPPAPVVPPPRAPSSGQARSSRPGKSAASSDQALLDPSALVEDVWSRTAEWGPTFLVLAAWATFIFVLVYFGLGTEYLWTSLLTLLLGGLVGIVLSYPILITLERPVRITPEQALRDYYSSLSHHWPHFRRMWLLLSTAGRISTAYGSFEGFKAYWKDRLATLREGHAGSLTPLVFEVVDFKADKSAGKVRIDVEYALKIWVRGKRKEGAIQVIPMAIALVRGPDRMWYLEDGTLGRDARAARSTSQSRS